MGSTKSPSNLNALQPAPVYTPSTPVALILESIVHAGNARSTSSNSSGSQHSANNKYSASGMPSTFPTYPPPLASIITDPLPAPIPPPFFSFPLSTLNGASPIVRTPSFLHSSTGGSLRYTALPYLPPDSSFSPAVADTGIAMPAVHEATARRTPLERHASPVQSTRLHDVMSERGHEHEDMHPDDEYSLKGSVSSRREASFSMPEPTSSPAAQPQAYSNHKSAHSRSKSKSSKINSSNAMHERILEELRRAREGTNYSSSHSPSHSRSRLETDSNATPTPEDQEHARRHRSKHHKHSSSSSSSLSAIIVLANERLARETQRANAAEREAQEVLALFKTLHVAKNKVEHDFLRVKEELGLYKIQLDIAQKEIYRAQEIVDRVDRQRANAEDENLRLTSKLRRLQEERAVSQALDEGRRIGYEEGLRHGRVAMQPYTDRSDSDDGEPDRNSRVTRFTYPRDDARSMDASLRSTEKHRGHRDQPRLRDASKSDPPAKRRRDPLPPASVPPAASVGPPPDTAPFAPTLPVPTVATPMPVQAPDTQPPAPKAMPSHQPLEQIHVRPRRHDPNAPIHPVPWNNAPPSPSASHRDVVLPPDNYIPMMGANNLISLPPPHDLSHMVAPDARSVRSVAASAPVANLPAPSGASSIGGQRPRSRPPSAFRVVNQDPSERSRRASRPPISIRQQPRPEKDGSSSYQYQSELDALSPPRDYREYVPGSFYGRPEKTGNGTAQKRPDSAEMLAERWRTANPEYSDSGSPYLRNPGAKDLEHPSTPGPRSPYGKPATLTGGAAPPIRTPRQTRDIVLPMPDMPAHRPPSRPKHESPYIAPSNHLAVPSTPYGRPNLNTEISNVSVPGIDIQTPSTLSPASVRSDRSHAAVNPGYLTPESANRVVPLPSSRQEGHSGDLSLGLSFSPAPSARSFGAERLRGGAGDSIEMTLPTNDLPPGFVPLSPLNIGR